MGAGNTNGGGSIIPDLSWKESWEEAESRVAALKDARARAVFGRFVGHLREGNTLLHEIHYPRATEVADETPDGVLGFFLYMEIADILRYVSQEALDCVPAADGVLPPGDLGEAQYESELMARHALLAEMATRDPRVSERERELVRRNMG
ncbi:MAG TPA: hypothetical protein VFQ39_04945, partial [Longimicrobium sp.]|nr:hypothetical protein [Longimicrobium sp.]